MRIANAGDVDAITALLVLTEIADAIPTLVHTPQHRDALRADVEKCCAQPTSWITLGTDGQVSGFLVGNSKGIDSLTRATLQGLELRYAGVRADRRHCGHFRSLLDSATALRTPLYAVVKFGNKSNMAQRLENVGFVTWDPIYKMGNETAWVWVPPSS